MPDSGPVQVEDKIAAERIIVRGLVQGVGFRPTVWRLAHDFKIHGSVTNSGRGVEITAQATAHNLNDFIKSIKFNAPRLSRIDEINRMSIRNSSELFDFQIVESETTAIRTGVVPDAAVCEACLGETFDASARRFRYPFTNCTHCGPRFSIVQDIPYDRGNTTMSDFEMCTDCRAEYKKPSDRRFHAQPIACCKCGPKVWLECRDGNPLASNSVEAQDGPDAVCTLIEDGHIVAVKGIGGFQLACDASSETAVSRLRKLKHRERKPFALMVRDIDTAQVFCDINEAEQRLLKSHESPVVVLDRLSGRNQNFVIAHSVAPGLNTFGVMLPNTPLHHLILQRMTRPIVLTSGNLSDEPQCIDNKKATEKLCHIAKYFLMNNRPIAQRIDDSVVKVLAGQPRVFRRARGYAPSPFVMPNGFEGSPSLLAFGGELKNTFCLMRDGKAIVSQHIGDLENAAAYSDYRHNLGLYETLYQHRPAALVCDLHPEYLSGKLARKRAEDTQIPLFETQHHHAHIASCLAENMVPLDAPPVIGVALDGLGFGDDGTFWGGEFLLADYLGFKRLGTFKPVAMPGGVQAIKEPWRSTYAHLAAEMGWPHFELNYDGIALFDFLKDKPRAALDSMIEQKINSPFASSCGRLFDAVAAAIGICREHAVYEGQGAIELEAIVDENTLSNESDSFIYPFAIRRLDVSNLPYLEPYNMWRAILDDLAVKTPAGVMAARFHKGLADAIVRMIEKLYRDKKTEIPEKAAVLSGGVWQNKVLLEQVIIRLERLDFKVLTHRLFPSNDGGLSLGQAAIGAARLLSRSPR